jgi:hypothetical protein
MKNLLDLIKTEPAMAQALIQAAIIMFTAFGLKMTVDQVAAVTGFTALFLGFVTRTQVTPNQIVARQVEVALNTPAPERKN